VSYRGRVRTPGGPERTGTVLQAGEPLREAVTPDAAMKPDQKMRKASIHKHRHFRLWKDTPYRPRQAPVPADFRDPAPTLIVYRERDTRAENGQGLLRITATREINAAERRSRVGRYTRGPDWPVGRRTRPASPWMSWA